MTAIEKYWALLIFVTASACSLYTAQPYANSPETDDNEPIRIVASIKPLALIARDLLGDSGEVEVLVSGGASPHDYSLKASDMRRLQEADLVIWMGPALERFLQKPLAGLPPERILSLAGEPGATEPAGAHAHADDLHQWLDPAMAQDMARAVARHLQEGFPERRAGIEAQLLAQLQVYESLDQEVEQVLTSVADAGFVVRHRGYDYFVDAYGLNQLGWISPSPEQPPGVRHLYQLEKRLRARGSADKAQCLFVEESHRSPSADTFAEQLELRTQALDILGESAGSYTDLMRGLAEDVAECLAAPQ